MASKQSQLMVAKLRLPPLIPSNRDPPHQEFSALYVAFSLSFIEYKASISDRIFKKSPMRL